MALYIVIAVLLLFLATGMTLSWISHAGEPPGLLAGHLRACPATPNCVCSEYSPGAAFIEPLYTGAESATAWRRAQSVVSEMGGKISRLEKTYLAATFASPFFRVVDDVELRLDTTAGVIHIRSASRVGYSDLGANRKRVELLRALFSVAMQQ